MDTPKIKDRLQSLLHFTDDDLEANRAGYMTEQQRKLVKKHTQRKAIESAGSIRDLIYYSAFCLEMTVCSASFGVSFPPIRIFAFIFLSAFLLFLFFYILSADKKWREYQNIPLKGEVHYRMGILWLEKGEFLAPSYLIVDSKSFLVKNEVHRLFSQLRHEHKNWILYYSPYNDYVLSAEVLPD